MQQVSPLLAGTRNRNREQEPEKNVEMIAIFKTQ